MAALSFALSLCLADAGAAQVRSVKDLMVQSVDDSGRTPLAEPSPLLMNGYEVLLIVDAGRSNSLALLQMIQRSDYDGHGMVLLALGSEDPAHLQAALSESASQIRWVRGELWRTLAQLELAGSPVLLGIDPDGRVRWIRAGVPERIEPWIEVIRRWTTRTPVGLRPRLAP